MDLRLTVRWSCLAFLPLLSSFSSAQLYRDLHDLGGTVVNSDGMSGPDGAYGNNVSLDSAGNMYGTANAGGPNGTAEGGPGDGVVWRLSSTGAYSDLHDFGGTVTNANGKPGLDGRWPCVGVTIDSHGDLFGTAQFGGPVTTSHYGDGMVWELTSTGQYKDLHDFGGRATDADGKVGPDGWGPEGGVSFDSAGNMYGTTYEGGANDSGMVWEITNSGEYADLHDFGGTVKLANGTTGLDGIGPNAGVSVDVHGNLYGTASVGGPNTDSGIVWEITFGGSYVDLHDFGGTVTNANGTSGPDGRAPECLVTVDGSGDLFGTCTGGGPNESGGPFGPGAGLLWKINSAGAYSDLHDFGGTAVNANGKNGADGANPVSGVVMDASENIYGSTDAGGPYSALVPYGGGIAFELTKAGGYIDLHDFGGTLPEPGGHSIWDGQQPDGGVTFDGMGNLYGSTLYGGANGQPVYGYGMVWCLSASSLKGASVTPNAVIGGTTATGNVTLSSAAPIGGVLVSLTSNKAVASVPASVEIAEGATSASFSITTSPVAANTVVALTAVSGGVSQKTTLTVEAPAVSGLSVSPSTVVGPASATGTVTINSPALSGGLVVSLASSGSSASVPASVMIAAGQTSNTFTVKAATVGSKVSITLSAKTGSVSATAAFTINPPGVQSVSLSPSSVVGGSAVTGTVTITGAAPSTGVAVSLASGSTSATVPASVTVPAGKTTAAFRVSTSAVANPASVAITASDVTASSTATLTINPPTLSSLGLSPSSLVGGGTSTGTVTLSGPAPTGGMVVSLSSNSPAATVPTTVTVSAGAKTATFPVKTSKVTKQTTATITATLAGVSQTATLTIKT